ncbi:MAG: hypothetical protein QOG76_8302 [Pseudonocardiales bacterium]|jgi:hypothetical protein|nr:hypothetical protein [Pseudonocardiales bacterium]
MTVHAPRHSRRHPEYAIITRVTAHTAALRPLFNRVLGQLYRCLNTGQTFDAIPRAQIPIASNDLLSSIAAERRLRMARLRSSGCILGW